MVRLSAAERREQIIQVALAVFGEGGFVSTSTETVAARAGISQAYLFKVFGTKKDLILAVMDRNSAQICEMFTAAAATLDDPGQQLIALGARYAQMVADKPEIAGVMLHGHTVAATDPDIGQSAKAGDLRVLRHLRALTSLSHREVASFYGTGIAISLLALVGVPDLMTDESLSAPQLYEP